MSKVIKRVRRWVTKKGVVKEKTYYYSKIKSSKPGRKNEYIKAITAATDEYVVTRGRQTDLSKELVDILKDSLRTGLGTDSNSTIKDIDNLITKKIKQGASLTFGELSKEFSPDKIRYNKAEQFIINLGYDTDSFLDSFGLTIADLQNGSFKEVTAGDNSVIEFKTTKGGKELIYHFIWDYNQGLIKR